MESFHIKASSWVIYCLTFFLILVTGGLLARELYPKINTVVYTIGLFAIAILAIRRFGIASTEWVFTKNEIQLQWVSQFIFHKRPDIVIKWDDIKGYQIRKERSFVLLKIVLKNGTVIRLWHDYLITKDDFQILILRFLERVEEHNERELEKETSLSKET